MLVTRTKRHPAVNLVPMIDVLSFLLIFFILFTTFKTAPAGININLPQAGQSTDKAEREIVILVDRDGRMYTSDGPRSADAITEWLKQRLASGAQTVITIKADRETQYENVVSAIDAVKAAGASRLQLAVESIPDRLR